MPYNPKTVKYSGSPTEPTWSSTGLFPWSVFPEVTSLAPTISEPSMAPSATTDPSKISMSPSCGDYNLIISIVYDSYPEETSYELKKVVPETWPMEWQETDLAHHHSGSSGDKTHEESFCLDDGLYSFSFYDSYGDGFTGRYSLYLVWTGETIIEGDTEVFSRACAINERDNEVLLHGEQVEFRLPFDEDTLEVMTFESLVRPSLAPTSF